MPIYLALGVVVTLLLVLFGRWFVATNPRDLARGLRWAAIGLVVAVAILLAATEQFGLLLMWVAGWTVLIATWRRRRLARDGPVSAVDTAFLHMELHHASGLMTGRVLSGRHSGRDLAQLTLADLLALRQECAGDASSLAVLESYIDRTQPADWRTQADAAEQPVRGDQAMTRERAYEILGLAPGADDTAIREAHRRLMLKNHPDLGGSAYIAAEINRARDILLGG
jgi:hypothetical protein